MIKQIVLNLSTIDLENFDKEDARIEDNLAQRKSFWRNNYMRKNLFSMQKREKLKGRNKFLVYNTKTDTKKKDEGIITSTYTNSNIFRKSFANFCKYRLKKKPLNQTKNDNHVRLYSIASTYLNLNIKATPITKFFRLSTSTPRKPYREISNLSIRDRLYETNYYKLCLDKRALSATHRRIFKTHQIEDNLSPWQSPESYHYYYTNRKDNNSKTSQMKQRSNCFFML